MYTQTLSTILLLSIWGNSIAESKLQSFLNYNEKINFIKDFLIMQNISLKTTAYLCWELDVQLRLLRELHKNNFQIAILNNLDGELIYKQPEEHHLYVVDLQCLGYDKILEKANNLNLFKDPFKWLIFNNTTTLTKDIPINLNIYVDSKFYVVNYKKEAKQYHIKMIYKIQENSINFNINFIGIWSINESFIYYDYYSNIIRDRFNLQYFIINISLVITNNESLNHLSDYRFLRHDPLSKMNYVMCNYLVDFLNGTLNVLITDTWGYINEKTGNYNGMIGDLLNNTAIIGATPMFITLERLPIVDFVADPTRTKLLFMFRSPPLSYVQNVYTLPFDTFVWMTILLVFAIITIVMYLIIKWERSENLNKTQIVKPKLDDILMLEVGIICQQGADALPNSGAGRIAAFFVLINATFIFTSYSAFIVVLFQTTTDSIKTVEDLLYSRIQLGVELTPYSYHWFAVENEITRKTLFETKIAPKGSLSNFMSVEKGIRKMKDEFFAFHVEYGPGYKTISEMFDESEKCGFQEIDVWNKISPWVTVQKNSSYRELIKIGYKKLNENGLQDREYKRFYSPKPKCTNAGNRFKSIELIDSYFVFIIFGSGVTISLIILIIEIIYKKQFSKELDDNYDVYDFVM